MRRRLGRWVYFTFDAHDIPAAGRGKNWPKIGFYGGKTAWVDVKSNKYPLFNLYNLISEVHKDCAPTSSPIRERYPIRKMIRNWWKLSRPQNLWFNITESVTSKFNKHHFWRTDRNATNIRPGKKEFCFFIASRKMTKSDCKIECENVKDSSSYWIIASFFGRK